MKPDTSSNASLEPNPSLLVDTAEILDLLPPIEPCFDIPQQPPETACITPGTGKVLTPLMEQPCTVTDALGNTPLHYAILTQNLLTTYLLLESGASIAERNHQGETPFHLAFQGSPLFVLLLYQEIIGSNLKMKQEIYLLMCALQLERALRSLEDTFNPRIRNTTTLQSAIDIANKRSPFPLFLTSTGSLFDAETVLHALAIAGDVFMLLKLGQSLIETTINEPHLGCTPLQFAVFYQSASVIDYLCLKGARLDIVFPTGYTLLHTAVDQDDPRMIEALCKNIVRCKQEHLFYQGNAQGLSPLHLAVAHRKARSAKALLEGGVDPRRPTVDGITPLTMAICIHSSAEMLWLLQEYEMRHTFPPLNHHQGVGFHSKRIRKEKEKKEEMAFLTIS